MRLAPLALALLLLAPCALPDAALAREAARDPARDSGRGGTPAVSELAEQDLLFAHHRMLGTEPDFRVLAELAVDSRPPPTRAVRDPERERRYLLTLAERRLRAEFAAFDLNRVFSIRVGTEILGHDPARGGIPLEARAIAGLSLRNMTDRGLGFTLRFRNPEVVATIPTADAEAAGRLLQRARLVSLGGWAGHGVLTIRFAFAGALPLVTEVGDAPVMTEIVSAEVETDAGVALHAFAAPGARQAAAAARRAGIPPLAQGDLSGVRVGMPLPQARKAALRALPDALATGFFDAPPDAGGGRPPACASGLVADLRAFGLALAPEDSYGACLAFHPGEADGPLAGRVAEVVQLRFLPGQTPEALRSELTQRFGLPAAELPTGHLLWIGRDPEAGLLELRAEFAQLAEGGPRREPGTLLALTLRPRPPADGQES